MQSQRRASACLVTAPRVCLQPPWTAPAPKRVHVVVLRSALSSASVEAGTRRPWRRARDSDKRELVPRQGGGGAGAADQGLSGEWEPAIRAGTALLHWKSAITAAISPPSGLAGALTRGADQRPAPRAILLYAAREQGSRLQQSAGQEQAVDPSSGEQGRSAPTGIYIGPVGANRHSRQLYKPII
jgi:hypothetical protein